MSEAVSPPQRRTGRGRRVLRVAVGLILAGGAVALILVVPGLLGASWREIGSLIGSVPLRLLAVLAAVWIAGLWAHSFVLAASLPGLSARRAMSLNLAGSAVANTVPLGGAVSMGLTTTMARSWGFRPGAIGAFLTVSNVWNLLARLALGVLGLAWWFGQAGSPHPVLAGGVLVAVGVVVAVLALVLWSAPGGELARRVTRGFGAALDRRPGGRGRSDRRARESLPAALMAMRRSSLAVARRSWRRLSLGMLVYTALLCVLLDLCLRFVGAPSPVITVVAAVALERLVTALPLTPGSVGFAELGLAGALTIAGLDPVSATAATLLYRLFTFALEIPVGLLVAAGWGVHRRRAGTGGRPGRLSEGTA